MLQQLETDLRREGSKCADRARAVRELARGAASITRSLARGLSPVIRTAGLARSLRELAITTRAMHGVDCRVELSEENIFERYSNVAANELYCIVKEAVTNAVKHGKPRGIEIEGRVVGQRLLLNITDDGKGFTSADPAGSSTGLKIMQYRARDLGGSLTITRRRDAGTLVVCSCPIPES
jgi:signal transduction histidine kinase